MATAKPRGTCHRSEGGPLYLGRQGQDREGRPRRDPRHRRRHGPGHAAPPGHPGDQDPQAEDGARRTHLRKGHRAVHPPARHDDEIRCAAAAGLRHRNERLRQRRARAPAQRHPHRRRDRLQPVAGLRQAPCALRPAVLQPGRSGRAGGHPRRPARPHRHLQGKRSSRSRARSSRRCSILPRWSWWRVS